MQTKYINLFLIKMSGLELDEDAQLLYELNLDKKRCVYCKIENPNNLVKCSKCQYFFCNNISNGCKYSHIIYHMKKSGHSNILTNPFNPDVFTI